MTNQEPRVRQNYLAIVVAAIVCFLFEAGWYSFFLQSWLVGIGRSHEWLSNQGVSPALQYAVALLAEFVMAAGISCLTQLTGPQTAFRGAKMGALLWLGFVMPTWATDYAFELRPYKLLAIDTGFWLGGMILMGILVGAWKKK